MKKEVKYKVNDNGSYTEIITVTQTPEDGFVPEEEMRPLEDQREKRYFKGYAAGVSYNTNDPRVTRPFVYGACGLLMVIGIVLLLLHIWMIGIPFIVMTLITFFGCMKSIRSVEEELKEKKSQDDIWE